MIIMIKNIFKFLFLITVIYIVIEYLKDKSEYESTDDDLRIFGGE